MVILQINAVGQTKSTGRNCKEIADYINNYTSYTCYTAFAQGQKDKYSFQVGNIFEWKIHGFLSRVFGKQGYFSINGTKKLIKFMDQIKPDIIHLNNLHGNYINLPLLFNYIKNNNISVVVTLHDCWFYTGKCTHYTLEKCYKWKNGCYSCPKLKEDNISWFFDCTSKMWKDKKKYFENINKYAIIGVSDWIVQETKMSFLNQANFITRIYNWIDLNIFKPKDVKSLKDKLKINDKFVLLCVANEWSNKKGLDNFLLLANMLVKDFFIIVGQIPSIDLPKNVIHIDATNNVNELVSYYCIADVFLQLSKEETFGKVVAEALACGTPVITNNLTANPELVAENCGYIANDLNEIIKSINIVKSKGKLFYSKNCRNFAELNFKMKDRIKEYIDVYEKLLTL